MTEPREPHQQLLNEAAHLGTTVDSASPGNSNNRNALFSRVFAAAMDAKDPLALFRNDFCIPKKGELLDTDSSIQGVDPSDECVYLCGNSLGLQPGETSILVNEELQKWRRRGVVGHFDDSPRPWVSIDEHVVDRSEAIVGAKPGAGEVAIMNTLTVNLHLLMVSFYRPTPKRHKILMETKAFPSDFYAIESQIKFHGFDPSKSLLEAVPRPGALIISEDDICKIIEEQGEEIALVIFSGVQFYTGQVFDMKRITAAAHAKGCTVGFDLAHAVGNVELHLHDWDVDFACWCSYKYLNSGPGGIAGAFVHERHATDFERPRFAGWWGHNTKTRFEMEYKFDPMPGAKGYQHSNPPVLQTVSLLASLRIFERTSMSKLREKSKLLTAYLELLIENALDPCADGSPACEIISPREPERRGCQLSLLFKRNIKPVFKELEKRGVIGDMREPDVMRIAPTPLYNTFTDVYNFVRLLNESVSAVDK
eukprot:UC4_evm6s506